MNLNKVAGDFGSSMNFKTGASWNNNGNGKMQQSSFIYGNDANTIRFSSGLENPLGRDRYGNLPSYLTTNTSSTSSKTQPVKTGVTASKTRPLTTMESASEMCKGTGVLKFKHKKGGGAKAEGGYKGVKGEGSLEESIEVECQKR